MNIMLCSVKFVNKIEYRIWPPFCFSGQCAVLLWQLTAACIKTGRPQIARRAVDLIESRLHRDCWPEYYDGKLGRYVGKQARKYQTWSIAGYLVAKMLLEDPSHIGMISLEEDKLMYFSVNFDLPTGATIVCTFGLALIAMWRAGWASATFNTGRKKHCTKGNHQHK